MLGINGADKKPPLVVISDGTVISSALEIFGFSMDWLNRKLKAKNLNVKDVFLMTINESGEEYVVTKSI